MVASLSQAILDYLEVLAWPVVALAVAGLLVSPWGRLFAQVLIGRVRRVAAFGVELELSVESASRIKTDLESTFREYRSTVRTEFNRRANALRIGDLLSAITDSAVVPNLTSKGTKFRCTIHVGDVLFEETLYQLLDYYPPSGGRRTGGRTFSARYGIVGKAWRSGKTQHSFDVSTVPAKLVDDWGMLPQEAAAAGQGRRSFAAITLRHDGLLVGIFYADADREDAFDKGILKAVHEAAEKQGLTAALAELDAKMRELGPAFTVFET